MMALNPQGIFTSTSDCASAELGNMQASFRRESAGSGLTGIETSTGDSEEPMGSGSGEIMGGEDVKIWNLVCLGCALSSEWIRYAAQSLPLL